MSDVYFIIDGSWSTEQYKQKIIADVNSYMEYCPYKTFTVCVFAKHIDVIVNRMCQSYISDYDVGGPTRLYDSLEEIFVQADLECTKPPVIVIWTDGEDTASTRCTKIDIESAIQEYKTRGWKFDFMCINPFRRIPLYY